jgi:hypothetical protein
MPQPRWKYLEAAEIVRESTPSHGERKFLKACLTEFSSLETLPISDTRRVYSALPIREQIDPLRLANSRPAHRLDTLDEHAFTLCLVPSSVRRMSAMMKIGDISLCTRMYQSASYF